MKKSAETPRAAARLRSIPIHRVIDVTLLAAAIYVPMVIAVGGEDVFRVPKELAIIGVAITLAAASAIALIWHARAVVDLLRAQRVAVGVILAIVAWTAITTAFAANRSMAFAAFGSVCCMALIALVALVVFRRMPLVAAWAFLIPAVANSVVFLAQRLRIWGALPFTVPLTGDTTSTGFLGNIDYIGSYLPAPLLIAVALALSARRGRVMAWIAAIVIAAATLVSSITGIIAVMVGVALLLFLKTPRYALIGTAIVVLVTTGIFSFNMRFRSRAESIWHALTAREYDVLFSSRLTAFVAAGRMAREHPLFGVGPGNYAPSYFHYKLEAEQRHPQLLTAYSRTFNFGETHNDHLQTLAETGFIGYALFAVAVLWTARGSLTRHSDDERRELVRLLSLPLAATFSTLALAQFPLHLPESRFTYIVIAALCVAWRQS